ncbi:protein DETOXIFICATION 24 [Ricinus communis]|uniref:Protein DETOXIFICATION n=1 Tax=Ricinus communis TaxID=3988 RepID=B9SY87_RICCO|nr:protein DETOXIFICATION 24 [Ricinus communis]XP_015581956.1 protein DETOXIFICATION 24 [Ricinus communis]EEF31428.1 multidrug resistance pump, putative [Ricinus communis]|eukprot:XP_002530956.1 protein DETOXIFICATION 24 [Ricinus communis]
MDKEIEERLLGSEVVAEDLKSRVWTESKKIWRIAFPGIVARISSFGMIVITQLFIGHIGAVQLAAYALEQTIFVRFVNGIMIGMSSATETLCGQAFGAGQHHMMGIYLQRSWIVDGTLATILLPIFIFTTPILKLIGQETEIANVAGEISLWFIPFLYYFVFSLTLQMYLQAQMKNQIVGWISAISFGILVPLSWLFVSKLDLGISGAMGALNICSWLTVIGLFAYVLGGWCPETWKGLNKAAFKDLLPVIKLSISSGIMICLELWYNSILVLLAGYMKNATIAISAFSICLNISAWVFMICLGFLGAACVRVSNELGKGNAKATKFSIKVILCTSVCIGVVCFILCLIFGRQISYLFTDSEEVADSVSDLSVLLAFSMLFNSIQPVLSGVAVGAGLQSMVAYVNLGCYYGIGIPIGALLGYVGHLQVKGLWIGMLCGVVMQTLVLAFLIWRTDWDLQVNKALERLNRWFVDPSKESNEDENSNSNV